MMKRLFTMTALATLFVFSFAACSKDKDKENNAQTSPAVTQQPGTSSEDNAFSAEGEGFIALGGYFTKDNTDLVIYISDGSWHVNGVMHNTGTSPLILTGPLTYQEPLDLVYSSDGQELTFTFAENSVTAVAGKGDTYQAFAGTYQRQTDTIADSESVVPSEGSVLETLGRIAVTYYVTAADDASSYTFDAATATFDNAFMTDFIVNYTNLFLATDVAVYPEITTQYLCSTFEADTLDALLQNASAGSFTVRDLDLSESEIILKDGIYYVPCRGLYAGGISSSYTDSNPENIAETLLLEGTVVDINGKRSVFEMTIKTSANAAAGTTGIQLDSITYTQK